MLIKKLLPALALSILGVCGSAVNAQDNSGLFLNNYTETGEATAPLYVSPLPVPQWVGHTYYTYQPLYPHEMTYWHNHRYHAYYDGGRGLTRTGVHYYSPPVRTAASSILKAISLPR
ncbi:MAG: hypothetical protein KDB03_21340 [Planctomycetales bacterium]|nr:hypothetical protein [Planctomycetales bacterium]